MLRCTEVAVKNHKPEFADRRQQIYSISEIRSHAFAISITLYSADIFT